MKLAYPLLLLLLFCGSLLGQSPIERSVDDFIKAEMERQKIPGVSLAVVRDGKPLIVKGYGFANLEHQVPVKPETIFQSGSMGKQFTAFAVMLLVEEGKIGLEEKISKYLGDVPPAWSNITIRHLLTHTSGMTDYPDSFDFRRDFTEDELLKWAKEVPVAFAPGEKWQYSNLGFVTLGLIIHKASGKFYGDLLRERVFKPLGMTTARIINEADVIPNRAAGYRLDKGELKNQNWVSPSMNTTADGSLYLTVLDVMKWDDALTNGKLLSTASYDQMWTPVKLNNGKTEHYGFGWALREVNGKRAIEHGGAWQGFKSFIARFPDNNLTVIVFANSSNTNPARLANRIAEIIDPQLKPYTMTDPDPKLTADFRQLLANILKGDVDEKRFAASVRQALTDPTDRLIAHMKTIGPIQKFELLERNVSDAGVLYRYSAEFGSMTVNLFIRVGKDGRIDRFELNPD